MLSTENGSDMKSALWEINKEQWDSINKSIIKYTLPLILVFLMQIQAGQPIEDAVYTVYGAALQLVINIVSKLIAETK